MTGVHLHVSVLDFLIVLAYLVIASFVWRLTAAAIAKRFPAFGEAMGALL